MGYFKILIVFVCVFGLKRWGSIPLRMDVFEEEFR